MLRKSKKAKRWRKSVRGCDGEEKGRGRQENRKVMAWRRKKGKKREEH